MITKAAIVHAGHLHTQGGLAQGWLVTKQTSGSWGNLLGDLLAQGIILGIVQ